MKTIQIDQDIHTFLVSKAVDAGEPLSSIIRRELRLPLPPSTIEIEDDIYSYLVSKTVDLGESASHILRRELHLDSGPAPAPEPDPGHDHGPRVVEFHIPPATGPNAWNTREQTVVASVGDTLRIVNDDAVPHRLHTNGVPFPHPADSIAPGQSADFILQAPFDPPASQVLHDHNFGASSSFFLKVSAAS